MLSYPISVFDGFPKDLINSVLLCSEIETFLMLINVDWFVLDVGPRLFRNEISSIASAIERAPQNLSSTGACNFVKELLPMAGTFTQPNVISISPSQY